MGVTRFRVQLCEWRNHPAIYLGEEGMAARIMILAPAQLVPAKDVFLIEREEASCASS